MWDYAGDNYVHRLVQSKGDGKMVEIVDERGQALDDSKLDSVTLEVSMSFNQYANPCPVKPILYYAFQKILNQIKCACASCIPWQPVVLKTPYLNYSRVLLTSGI